MSDVSVNDIMMQQRTVRLDDFLNTRQWNLLKMPANLIDLFEFMDYEPHNNDKSTFWVFSSYLCLSDLLALRGLCKSSAELVTTDVQKKAITINKGMIGELRTNLWRHKCPFFDTERHLMIRMGIGIYDNLIEQIKF